MKIHIILLAFTLSLLHYFPAVFAKFNSNKFEKNMNSLRKVLKYIAERPEQMNIDAIAGVTLAEAFIQATFQHKNFIFLDNYQKYSLIYILKQAENLRIMLLANKNTSELPDLSVKINEPKRWIKPIIWRKINPSKKIVSVDDYTTEEIMKAMFNGHPQEKESDFCLLNLVRDCQFPPLCQELILQNDNSSGYPLAHKLFLMQSMFAFGCEIKIQKFFPYLSNKFCSTMLQELNNFEILDFPLISKDLATEQICFCGMEGYLDFLSDRFEQLIIDWQHPSGCYSGKSGNLKLYPENRVRRSSNLIDFGCTNHATGLGAAVLALIIRKNLELMLEY